MIPFGAASDVAGLDVVTDVVACATGVPCNVLVAAVRRVGVAALAADEPQALGCLIVRAARRHCGPSVTPLGFEERDHLLEGEAFAAGRFNRGQEPTRNGWGT